MINSAEEFVQLRSSQNPSEYHRAAHEMAPVSVWMDIIERYPDYRQWVAHNKTVPIEVLRVLATDPNSQVRYFVATKNKLTPDLLEQLALDSDDSVRARIASHKKASLELLRSMAHDKSELVREAAMTNLQRRQLPTHD